MPQRNEAPRVRPTDEGERGSKPAIIDMEDFDLTQIPFDAERRLGRVFKEGERKYDRDNWRKGADDTQYQLERANHALKHFKIYLHWLQFHEDVGEENEDHLAKVMWFCATQMELERLEGKLSANIDAKHNE